jgi:hypothetical protein
MTVGRPLVYTGSSTVRINAKGRTKLQSGSARRAVINLLVDNRGKMTFAEINQHFDMDMMVTISDLVQIGWVEVTP